MVKKQDYVCPHCKVVQDIDFCPNCNAPLDRAGKCPALCHQPPAPPPKYDGPEIIGLTHIGRIARGA